MAAGELGEAKWARSEDGSRLVRALERKAASLPNARQLLSYAVCARNEVRNAPPGTLIVTAKDIFDG